MMTAQNNCLICTGVEGTTLINSSSRDAALVYSPNSVRVTAAPCKKTSLSDNSKLDVKQFFSIFSIILFNWLPVPSQI